MDYLFIIFGILFLYLGGEALVRGAVGLSLRHGLSPMIIGLTVMAFGTSAPELVVSVQAALSGFGDIAFGNVVGSNIANILLILGAPALLYIIATDSCDCRHAWYEMIAATLALGILSQFAPFGLFHGAIMIALFVIVLIRQFSRAKIESRSDKSVPAGPNLDEEASEVDSRAIIWLMILSGIIFLPLGAQSLVHGSIGIAANFGISEAAIGLSVVAIGTSLPELAATLVSAKKGEAEMAIGNVFGSNLFNILLILGVTGMLSTNHIDESMVRIDIPIMALISFASAAFVFWGMRLGRLAGLAMVIAYIVFLVMRVA